MELRERLAKVEQWKERRAQIERELESVWVEGGELGPPAYVESVETGGEGSEASEGEASEVSPDEDVEEHEDDHAGHGDGLFSASSSWNPAHRPS